jgi:L,D-transpeptidase ErfK/SrfK
MSAFIPAILLLAQLVGGEYSYKVQNGDTLTAIGARFGVDARVIAEGNGIRTSDKLTLNQDLTIDNRHIVPNVRGSEIVVNVPQRMLFYFSGEIAVSAFPIAAGRPSWRTQLGNFEVLTMEQDPTWDVPVSIQEEMRRAGKPVLTKVPPSPQNPLGQFWIGLSLSGIGIHGTNAPSSIYGLVTHGCIRLHPDDIQNLFSQVDVGTLGITIYEPVLIARIQNAIFLEVHPDLYKKGPDPLNRLLDVAGAEGFLDMLDLPLAKEVIRKHDGIARDVTRHQDGDVAPKPQCKSSFLKPPAMDLRWMAGF